MGSVYAWYLSSFWTSLKQAPRGRVYKPQGSWTGSVLQLAFSRRRTSHGNEIPASCCSVSLSWSVSSRWDENLSGHSVSLSLSKMAASQCPNGIFRLVDSFVGLKEKQIWSTKQPGFANYPVRKTTETTENLLCIGNVRAAERIEWITRACSSEN